MKILYLECNMGTAGDILMSALSELIPDPERFLEKMNALGLPGVRVFRDRVRKKGISGAQIHVMVHEDEEHSVDVSLREPSNSKELSHKHDQNHTHRSTHEHAKAREPRGILAVHEQIRSLPVSAKVKQDACSVYDIIAEAEAAVHGVPIQQVHFHEVGSLDAIADIVGVAMLIEEINPDKILSSPIHVGSGHVYCSHGILPVPAPATAQILQGLPIYSGTIRGELCTPTGAALLKHFVQSYTSLPAMTVRAVSYGMGQKNFEAVNCMRAFLGESNGLSERALAEGPNDEIAELSCNLDDMTGEQIGFAAELLFEQGALDVYTTPIQMKKNRPAVMLTCLCSYGDADRMAQLLLEHTTTFGVRRTLCSRYILERESVETETPYGIVRMKKGTGYGIEKSKAEYEDLALAAKKAGISITQMEQRLKR